MVFIRFSAHCLLWPWPLTFWPKASQHICDPKYICDQDWINFFHWLLRYGVHKFHLACCDLDLWLFDLSQHICDPKYICDQDWVKFPLLVIEIWYSQGFQLIACCDLDLSPFDPKIESSHLWPKYICDQDLVKFPLLVFEIWYSRGFQLIACCDLDLWPKDPKSNQQIYVPKYICDHAWVKFPLSIFTTACNATHGIAVEILSVCPSVCPSVRPVYCDKTKWRTADIFIQDETAITLVLTSTMVDGRCPLRSEIYAQSDPPPSKHADFGRFPLITSQP